jgi:hypothetical protein
MSLGLIKIWHYLFEKLFGLTHLSGIQELCLFGFNSAHSNVIGKRKQVLLFLGCIVCDKIEFSKFYHRLLVRGIFAPECIKLRQRIIAFLGTNYFKIEKRFEPSNHIFNVFGTLHSEEDILAFLKNEQKIKLNLNRPLWELHFFENYSESDIKPTNESDEKDLKSAIILKIHSSIADSISLSYLIRKISDEFQSTEPTLQKIENYSKLTAFERISFYLQLPFYFQSSILQLFSKGNTPIFEKNRDQGVIQDELMLDKGYNLEKVKRLSKKLNLSFTELYTMIINLAISDYLRKHFADRFTNIKKKHSIEYMIPFSCGEFNSSNHQMMGNNSAPVFIELPLAEMKDDAKAVFLSGAYNIKKMFMKYKNTQEAKKILEYYKLLTFYLPASLIAKISAYPNQTHLFTITSFQEQNNCLYIDNKQIIKYLFAFGSQSLDYAQISLVRYADKVHTLYSSRNQSSLKYIENPKLLLKIIHYYLDLAINTFQI